MSDWFAGNGAGHAVDAVALVSDAADGVAELVRLGALVSLGTTSDGGALGLTVTLDGRWRREYFRSTEELLPWLADAIAAVAAVPQGSDAPSGPRQRTRGSRGR